MAFTSVMPNLYSADVDQAVAFYRDLLGGTQTFRTPADGPAVHVELRLGDFTIALSSRDAVPEQGLPAPTAGHPLELVLGCESADDAVAVVRRARAAGAANVGFLCDLYHLASNGDDIDAAIAAHADLTAHVQIADAPGRGEPGSGELDLDRYLAELEDHGYRGWVSLEYKPTGSTEASRSRSVR